MGTKQSQGKKKKKAVKSPPLASRSAIGTSRRRCEGHVPALSQPLTRLRGGSDWPARVTCSLRHRSEEDGLCALAAWVLILTPPPAGCVIFMKSLNAPSLSFLTCYVISGTATHRVVKSERLTIRKALDRPFALSRGAGGSSSRQGRTPGSRERPRSRAPVTMQLQHCRGRRRQRPLAQSKKARSCAPPKAQAERAAEHEASRCRSPDPGSTDAAHPWGVCTLRLSSQGS